MGCRTRTTSSEPGGGKSVQCTVIALRSLTAPPREAHASTRQIRPGRVRKHPPGRGRHPGRCRHGEPYTRKRSRWRDRFSRPGACRRSPSGSPSSARPGASATAVNTDTRSPSLRGTEVGRDAERDHHSVGRAVDLSLEPERLDGLGKKRVRDQHPPARRPRHDDCPDDRGSWVRVPRPATDAHGGRVAGRGPPGGGGAGRNTPRQALRGLRPCAALGRTAGRSSDAARLVPPRGRGSLFSVLALVLLRCMRAMVRRGEGDSYFSTKGAPRVSRIGSIGLSRTTRRPLAGASRRVRPPP